MAYVGKNPKFEGISTSKSSSGATISNSITNTSNTASSDAAVTTTVGGTSAGDAYFKAEISGGQAYTWGLDNSASDAWVLSASSTLGTTNAISVSTAGVPTLTTPVLGVASATSINKVAITAPASSATLTIADGKTLTASNTLTFTGTDGSSVAFGAGGTAAYTGGTLAQFAATTSLELKGVISDETGSGALVFADTPTLVTPVLGVATATSINKVAITAPATSATLTVADGKTLTVSNTLTFTGTDSSSVAFGTGGTVAYTANKLSAFASTTSAELAGVISNETGSGALVFGTSPSLTTPLITGVSDGSNASTGIVGEYVSNGRSSDLAFQTIASGNAFDVDSAATVSGGATTGATGITLTAGDWDITGQVWVNPASAVVGFTQLQAWVGTATGNSTTGQSSYQNYTSVAPVSASALVVAVLPTYRVSITGTTTYYLKAAVTYTSATTFNARGTLRARRVR